MTLPIFSYPVLCFEHDFVRLRESWDSLTTTTAAGLKNNYFQHLLIVDSNGQALRVKNAHKLRGVGLFWGYNIFFNQQIKVQLEPDGGPFMMSLSEIKRLVSASLKAWHGWAARGDFEELKKSVREARTIPELFALLRR